MRFATIPATADNLLPSPPCGGHWLRDVAGNLTPADAETAAEAGLLIPDASDTGAPADGEAPTTDL